MKEQQLRREWQVDFVIWSPFQASEVLIFNNCSHLVGKYQKQSPISKNVVSRFLQLFTFWVDWYCMAKPGNMKKHVPKYLCRKLVLQHSCPGHPAKTWGTSMPWYRRPPRGVTWAYRFILLHFQYHKKVMTLLMLPHTKNDNKYITRMVSRVGHTTDSLGCLTSECEVRFMYVKALLYSCDSQPGLHLPDWCTLSRGTSAAAKYPWCKCLPSQ